MTLQSVPATAAGVGPDVVAATTQAAEVLSLRENGDGDELEEDLDDAGVEGIDLDDEDGEDATSGSGLALTEVASKKKKKKKAKGKGKAASAVDKVKAALGASSSNNKHNGRDSASSSAVAQKDSQDVSDELYERILEQARRNVGPAEAAKLDRQAVAEMVECRRRILQEYFRRNV